MDRYRTITMVMGGPRSGSTWLSKIIDCHPDVLYRHEPDLVRIHDAVPHICREGEEDRHIAVTRAYLESLVDVRSLKTSGSRPAFRKSYEPAAVRVVRGAVLMALRAAGLVLRPAVINQVTVPEFVSVRTRGRLHLLVKSVASQGRAGLFAQALPEARFILLVRNPFGQIASRLRGEDAGRLSRRRRDPELLATRQAGDWGLSPRQLETCPEAEYLAWEWAILTQKALDELSGLPNVRVLRHLDLVREPIAEARALYNFIGLDWRDTTERFIARSSQHKGSEGYFDVMRDADSVVDRWRDELDVTQRRQIEDVVARTPLADRWPEFFERGRTSGAYA